jgi:hypothetical protein
MAVALKVRYAGNFFIPATVFGVCQILRAPVRANSRRLLVDALCDIGDDNLRQIKNKLIR